jgi:hypothetical protein
MAEPERQLDETRARQGVTLGQMRYVLLISFTLAVVAMILVAVFS